MAAVLSFFRIPVKNRSPPAPGRGVQHFGGRVEQGIADGSGHIAAALAAHGHDGGYAKGFAGGKQPLLALHHIHKPYRDTDDQRRAAVGGALKAALLIAGAFLVVGAIAILLMQAAWNH